MSQRQGRQVFRKKDTGPTSGAIGTAASWFVIANAPAAGSVLNDYISLVRVLLSCNGGGNNDVGRAKLNLGLRSADGATLVRFDAPEIMASEQHQADVCEIAQVSNRPIGNTAYDTYNIVGYIETFGADAANLSWSLYAESLKGGRL